MNYIPCNPRDAVGIPELFRKTFADAEGPTEGKMVEQLVRDLVDTTSERDLYCFVAQEVDQLVGCIFFSPITFETAIKAFILSPVAVRTDYQRKGLGQELIRSGLDALSTDGVDLVITYGDPRFYAKVGFQPVTEAVVPAPFPLKQPEGWLAQSLNSHAMEPISGTSSCVEALSHPEYW